MMVEPKKIMRPILHGYMKCKTKSLLISTAAITIAGALLYWFGYVVPHKRQYKEYYRHVDINEEFLKIAKTGVFDCVGPGGSFRKKPT